GVSVADTDSPTVTVTLTAAHGTLTVGTVAGGQVTGNGTAAVTITATPTAINASLAAAGLTYPGEQNFAGHDPVTLRANDQDQPKPLTATASMAVNVTPVNDAPVAQSIALATTEDTPVVGQLPATDADTAALTYTIVTAPTHGTLTITAAGTFVYTPAP